MGLGSDSAMELVSCNWELQVDNFREHLKSIMGEEEPIKMCSSVYTGVSGGERKLIQRKWNRKVSGLGARA